MIGISMIMIGISMIMIGISMIMIMNLIAGFSVSLVEHGNILFVANILVADDLLNMETILILVQLYSAARSNVVQCK